MVEFTPKKKPEYDPDLPLPPFRITVEDPLQPIALAMQMWEREHRVMYKSMLVVGVVVTTNIKERHPETVRALVQEVERLWGSVNTGLLIILRQDKEIDRLKAKCPSNRGTLVPI